MIKTKTVTYQLWNYGFASNPTFVATYKDIDDANEGYEHFQQCYGGDHRLLKVTVKKEQIRG